MRDSRIKFCTTHRLHIHPIHPYPPSMGNWFLIFGHRHVETWVPNHKQTICPDQHISSPLTNANPQGGVVSHQNMPPLRNDDEADDYEEELLSYHLFIWPMPLTPDGTPLPLAGAPKRARGHHLRTLRWPTVCTSQAKCPSVH